ncbi:CE1759 family FMN reductase [Kineococcus glutinatus]|uniref:FMN reductase n=1 Tax=Kineococcus glutinatus TaxID=1070872 RepID=A0ABP9HDS0_9ACTN
MTRTIVALSAGLGRPSSTRLLAERLADATAGALRERGETAAVRAVDLREHAHEVVDAALTGFAPAPLREVLDAVVAADGLVAVTPVFNASVSGLFKSFLDVVEPGSITGKPVLLGATGGSARHSLVLDHAMRPLFAYLGALAVPTGVFAAPEDWAGADARGGLSERVHRAGAELAVQVGAYAPPAPADPFALTVSFEQLLAGE